MRHATISLKKDSPKARAIENGKFACAGPHPNITGMKKHYWGMDAFCVKIGAYVYKVDAETYSRL